MILIFCYFFVCDVGRLLYLKIKKNYIFLVLKISYCFFVVDKMLYNMCMLYDWDIFFVYMYCVYKIIYFL